MSHNAWLTVDDLPTARTSRVITLPDGEPWLAILRGALSPLIYEENFELHGTLTPAEMAEEWFKIFNKFMEDPPMLVPPGLVSPYAGASPPDGWLLCDGAAVSRTTYAVLFAVIADWYGFGDGSTTFNVPDLVGRVAVGRDAGQTEFDFLGEPGGEKEHNLTTAEMPVHTHVQESHNHTQNSHDHVVGGDILAQAGSNHRKLSTVPGTSPVSTGSTTATNIAATATNQNTGGGEAHNNMPPYLVLNYIIKT